jgi:hypothetical protein
MITVFWDVTEYNLVDMYQRVVPSSCSDVGGDSYSEGLVRVSSKSHGATSQKSQSS